jgi:NAD(P)-dependent dehydrogenase (short-subunit alcohol dehydrogenase family)
LLILQSNKIKIMKKLVIIHGVTGAIGSACLSLFASQKDTVVYGISRKAKKFNEFFVDGKLPVKTLICSIFNSDTIISSQEVEKKYSRGWGIAVSNNMLIADLDPFIKSIPKDQFDRIYYIHALGVYPFEIDQDGNQFIHCDEDHDGIDDRCLFLTKRMFATFWGSLMNLCSDKFIRTFIFGGIADKHKPLVHSSWWKTMESLKFTLKDQIENHSMKNAMIPPVSIVNISSVLCPNELIDRPFVFSKTDADPQFWLRPEEVANFVYSLGETNQSERLAEYELFKKKSNFDSEYYEDKNFTPRKVTELFDR